MGMDKVMTYSSAAIPSEPFELLKCQQEMMDKICGIKEVEKIDLHRPSFAMRQLLIRKVMLKWGMR